MLASSEVADLAEPILRSLTDTFDESSMLCLYLEQQRRYTIIKVIHGTQLLRYDIQENRLLPLAWGAAARSILAFLLQIEIDDILAQAGSSAVTGLAVDNDTYADLELTRQRGYAFTPGQRVAESVGSGAPFFNASGRVIGSVFLTIRRNCFDPTHEQVVGHALIEHAALLCRTLGYTAPRK